MKSHLDQWIFTGISKFSQRLSPASGSSPKGQSFSPRSGGVREDFPQDEWIISRIGKLSPKFSPRSVNLVQTEGIFTRISEYSRGLLNSFKNYPQDQRILSGVSELSQGISTGSVISPEESIQDQIILPRTLPKISEKSQGFYPGPKSSPQVPLLTVHRESVGRDPLIYSTLRHVSFFTSSMLNSWKSFFP